MPAETTTQAIVCVPSAANATSLTSNGTAWANSSWVQMIASTSNAIILTGIAIKTAGGTNSYEYEVDVGTGAATSETVIATLRGVNYTSGTNSSGMPSVLPFVIPINNIASSTRVSIRFRWSLSSALAQKFTLMYYNTGSISGITTTANASLVAPSAATGASITPNGTAWANSAYTEVITSTSSAIILAGIVISPGTTTVEFEIDIATGAATSEVVVTTLKSSLGNTKDSPIFLTLGSPLDNINTSTRVSARMRKGGTNTSAWTVALVYYNKPL